MAGLAAEISTMENGLLALVSLGYIWRYGENTSLFRRRERKRIGRLADPSALIIDSQSVKRQPPRPLTLAMMRVNEFAAENVICSWFPKEI